MSRAFAKKTCGGQDDHDDDNHDDDHDDGGSGHHGGASHHHHGGSGHRGRDSSHYIVPDNEATMGSVLKMMRKIKEKPPGLWNKW